MPAYIGLYKFTGQGMAHIKEMPEMIDRSKELARQMGIRTLGVFATLGEYDLVVIGDAPDDLTLAAFSVQMARVGNVTTQTMRAYNEEELKRIIGRLP